MSQRRPKVPNWTRIAPCAYIRRGEAGIWLTVGGKAVTIARSSLEQLKKAGWNFIEISIDPDARLMRIAPSQNPDDFAWPVAKTASWNSVQKALIALGIQRGRYPSRVEDGALIFDCSGEPMPFLRTKPEEVVP